MSRCTSCLTSWVFVLLLGGILLWSAWKWMQQTCPPLPITASDESLEEVTAPIAIPTQQPYKARSFDLAGKLQGFSKKQITDHEKLYQGYVNSRNKITATLKTVDRDNLSKTYSPFRALKVAETYAMNGQLLHELYFENLTPEPTKPGPETLALINASFGSFENFKKDFLDTGKVARGWSIAAYCLDDGTLKNFLLDEHNVYVPVMVIPLLILDVYEHAYMIDFGIDRNTYLDLFWKQVNWDTVEKRIKKWVNKFKK